MDKDREDFDPNEWGNIELPGLSDDELHSKNWNIITNNREQSKDPAYIKKQLAGVQNANYRKRKSKQMKEIAQTKEWQAIYRESRKKIDKDKMGNKISVALKEFYKDPKNRKKRSLVSKKSNKDPKQKLDRMIKSYKARGYKPVKTPLGTFYCLNHASQAHGRSRSYWIKQMLERDPDNYHFVTWEEYDSNQPK